MCKNKSIKIEYHKRDIFRLQLLSLARKGKEIYENRVNLLDNCKYARELNNKYTLKDLFVNHWSMFKERFKYRLTRESVINSVESMIHCKDLSKGYLFFECPNCNEFHIQGLSCHSRFCPSCGQKYRVDRTIEVEKKLLAVPHRQFVFSIAKELRYYFLKYRDTLDLLFESVDDVLKSLAEGNTLGYIEFIHTFGRDLKWNPHIHVLIAERIIDKSNNISKYEYFSYQKLRKSFMTVILKKLGDFLKDNGKKDDINNFFKIKKKLYNKYKDGFYIYGPRLKNNTKMSIKNIARYIARYASHPAISQDRILDINFKDKLITWYYDPHEDDDLNEEDDNYKGRQYIKESFDDFIKRLLPHIPNKGFHQIRYYGFYSNKTKIITDKYCKLYTINQIKNAKSNNKWINKLISSYHYSPLLCVCGGIMILDISSSYFVKGG